MTTYYKFLRADGTGPYSSTPWLLPADGQPGAWMPAVTGDVVLCENGYHACTARDILIWMHDALYELEFDGEVVAGDGKAVGRRARLLRRIDTWNARTTRLFVADCAEHVLHLFEQRYPDDIRPRQAIAAVRAFVRGAIDQQALAAAQAAAWDAAWDAAWAAAGDAAGAAAGAAARAAAGAAAWDAAGAAAWDAAGDAAWDAARAAAGAAAWDAAGDAAWDAAWAAAGDAAGDAAWDAARAAAGAAAGDAAWDAARAAAGDAAWDAAGAAAWDAARAAAWDAAETSERIWQTARLLAYLCGEVG